MRCFLWGAFLFLVIMVPFATGQSYDIAQYWMLAPGKWKVIDGLDVDPGPVYHVYGGSTYLVGTQPFDPEQYGYTKLGTGVDTEWFSGSHDYYVIVTRERNMAYVDTIEGSNGFYYGAHDAGNTLETGNLGGPPDGLAAAVGGYHFARAGGFVYIDAYMLGLTGITVHVDPFVSDGWQIGCIVTWNSGLIFRAWYENEFGWIEDETEIMQVTASDLLFHAIMTKPGGVPQYTTFNPPVTLPRDMEVNEPVFYSGTITQGTESHPLVLTYMIVEDGLTVTTDAGTFNNCLKVKMTSIGIIASDTTVQILAPGVGVVQQWYVTIEEPEEGAHFEADYSEVVNQG
jgi:hypothetical protein